MRPRTSAARHDAQTPHIAARATSRGRPGGRDSARPRRRARPARGERCSPVPAAWELGAAVPTRRRRMPELFPGPGRPRCGVESRGLRPHPIRCMGCGRHICCDHPMHRCQARGCCPLGCGHPMCGGRPRTMASAEPGCRRTPPRGRRSRDPLVDLEERRTTADPPKGSKTRPAKKWPNPYHIGDELGPNSVEPGDMWPNPGPGRIRGGGGFPSYGLGRGFGRSLRCGFGRSPCPPGC